MNNMGKTVNELHAMLKLHEQTLPPKEVAPALHAIRAGRIQKNQKKKSHKAAKGNQGKGKEKMGYTPVQAPSFAPKPKNPPTPKKDNLAKDAICHQCGCGTHICITTQGLRGSRKLKPGALSLCVGDGHRAAVKAIGNYHLCLPSGIVLIMHNYHYAPSITRGIILVSRLYKDGFVNRFENDNSISVFKNNMIYFNAIPRDDIYEIVMSSSNTNESSMAKDLLGLIHTDVCGPFKIMSRQGAYYFVTFTNDFSRYGYVYLLKHKHEVFETFKVFQKEVENQLRKNIKSLRSDHGGEYMSQEFLDHLRNHGIITNRTPPYTLQHNGVSERRNRTLLDMVQSIMSQTTLLKSFWDYALECAARILNMVSTKNVDKTPYETAEFLENGLINQEASGSLKDLEIIQEEDMHPSLDTSLNHEEDDQEVDEPQSDINPIDRSTRTRHPRDRLCLYIDNEEHKLGDLGEPANYKAALLDPESDKWLNAMNVEMQSMKENEVWELVDLCPNAKTVGHKWLFKKKTDMYGAEHTYKALLEANGFTQTTWIDYEETFSPVVDIRAITILIAIAEFYDYEIWQIDVKTAFLNGYLNEEVYMEQPGGFISKKFPNRVCKLKRSIYGLKQASRQWNK
ncbi:retrotransposon protein, putative, ty1-copia subclass [Tanacetum coccineum]